MTNKQNMTLFAHYKNMINNLWADGQRTYTAKELNHYVGVHEKPTAWKRYNNSPFYTTRTYQTSLKYLGCITMIKRGLWQINGPIPEWFGSFHIKGLSGGYDPSNKYADHNCIYWKSLPAEHKVNPWKHTATNAFVETHPRTYTVVHPIVGETARTETEVLVYIDPNTRDIQHVCTPKYYIGNKEVSSDVFYIIAEQLKATNLSWEYLKELQEEDLAVALRNYAQDMKKYITKEEPAQTPKEKLYTEEEVMRMIMIFAERAIVAAEDQVLTTLENADPDRFTTLDWDNFNRTMSVELDLSKLDLYSAISEGVHKTIEDFTITAV